MGDTEPGMNVVVVVPLTATGDTAIGFTEMGLTEIVDVFVVFVVVVDPDVEPFTYVTF